MHCGAVAPPNFTVIFVFRSVYCFTLIFKTALTRKVDNMSSLLKTLCAKLNIRRLFGCAWEALQIAKVWSCEIEMAWAVVRGPVKWRQRTCLHGPVNRSNTSFHFWVPLRSANIFEPLTRMLR